MPYRFLTAAQVKRLYMLNIANARPFQPGLLESATDSPINHSHYGQKDSFALAGILAEKIILNHAYRDGNKRIALCAADMFLRTNGQRLKQDCETAGQPSIDQATANAHVKVATKLWTSEDLGRFYADIAEPIRVYPVSEPWSNAEEEAPLPSPQPILQPARAEHKFIARQGLLSTEIVHVHIGNLHESHIFVDEVAGLAVKSAITSREDATVSKDTESTPLIFFHDSRHFAHGDNSYPRLVLQQDLPRRNPSNRSPATLWLWGATHCLTLDGTPDHYFTQSAGESNQTLRSTLKLLEDM